MHRRPPHGFTYLGLLLAVALLGIGLAAASDVWSTVARRQRIAQLRWVGQQYVQAIGSYYEASPGNRKAYPRSMDDLTQDKRFPFTKRHLRRVYDNPLTGAPNWVLVSAPDGGFLGVRVEDPAGDTAPPLVFTYVPLSVSR